MQENTFDVFRSTSEAFFHFFKQLVAALKSYGRSRTLNGRIVIDEFLKTIPSSPCNSSIRHSNRSGKKR